MQLRDSPDLSIGHILHASITPHQAALATLVSFLDFDLQHQPLTKADAVSKLSGRPFGDRPKPKPGHYSYSPFRSTMITAVASISHVFPFVLPITVRRTSTVLNTSESKIRTLYGPLLFVATVQCGYGSSKPTIAMAERGSMSGSNRVQYALRSAGGSLLNGKLIPTAFRSDSLAISLSMLS